MSRKNYTMTDDQYDNIIAACQPVPMIMLQCGTPASPQENANRAWSRLGDELGFEFMTVEPGATKLEFSAVVVKPKEKTE